MKITSHGILMSLGLNRNDSRAGLYVVRCRIDRSHPIRHHVIIQRKPITAKPFLSMSSEVERRQRALVLQRYPAYIAAVCHIDAFVNAADVAARCRCSCRRRWINLSIVTINILTAGAVGRSLRKYNQNVHD
jgi:hypothetical protein